MRARYGPVLRARPAPGQESRASVFADVGQTAVDGLSQRVPGRQGPLTAHGRVAKQGHGVSYPPHGVIQVSQVHEAGQRVRMVGTEDPLGVRAAALGNAAMANRSYDDAMKAFAAASQLRPDDQASRKLLEQAQERTGSRSRRNMTGPWRRGVTA